MKAKKSLFLLVLFSLLFALCMSCGDSSTGDPSGPPPPPPPIEDPIVGGTGTPKTAWYTANTSAATFHIKDADELAGLAVLVNGATPIDFYNKTIVLDANLELSAYGKDKPFNGGKGWIPIGNWDTGPNRPFRGTFEGSNKSITGLYVNIDDGDFCAGLFGYVDAATIRDLKMLDANVSGVDSVGCVAGGADGSLISNCSATGKVNSTEDAGGIVGYFGESEMSGCNASVTVTCKTSTYGDAYDAGGLVGYTYEATITNCYATGAVSGEYGTGGLVGSVNNISSIVNSYATGAVKGDVIDAGGLVGYINSSTISKCYATGAVSCADNTGGLVGTVDEAEINRSFATGNVIGDAECIGGLAGYFDGGSINDCYATGSVSGSAGVGGLVGSVQFASGISKCYATGAVSGEGNCGGIAGYVEITGGLYYCAALNPSITKKAGSSEDTFNSLVGNWDSGSIGYCIAYDGMALPGSPATESVPGESTSVADIKKQYTYFNYMDWYFGGAYPWKMDASYPIPVLSWQDPATYPALPDYLK